MLGPAADPFFRALRVRVDGSRRWPVAASFAVAIGIAGSGAVVGPRAVVPLVRGATVALSAAAASEARLEGQDLELLICLPPDPNAFGAGLR